MKKKNASEKKTTRSNNQDWIGYVGEPRGIEKGRQEGRLEMAHASLANGLDVNLVATITGLDVGVVESLR